MSVKGSKHIDLGTRRGRRKQHRDYYFSRAQNFYQRLSDTWTMKRQGEVLIPLPEPVRAGWERFWTLRPDVAKSPDAKVFRTLLVIVQKVERNHRKDFAARDWRSGKKRSVPHRLRLLSERELLALDPKMQRFFNMVITRRKWQGKTEVVRNYECSKPWLFVSKSKPYYYTHQVVPNGDAVSEEKYLSRHVYGPSEFLLAERIRYHGDHFRDYDIWPDEGPSIEEEYEDR